MSESTYENATTIVETKDNAGTVVTYGCKYLLSANNTFPNEIIPAYYNLHYPCVDDMKINQTIAVIERRLLQVAAQAWYISSTSKGQGCIDHSMQPYNTWLVSVSSLPKDQIVQSMPCVLKNTDLDTGTCCTMVKSEMTFTPQGGYDSKKFTTFIASQFDSGVLTKGTLYSTEYAGSFALPTTADTFDVTSSRDNHTAADVDNTRGGYGVEEGPTIASITSSATNQNERERFTPIGGVVLGGLVLAFLGFIFVLTRRRRLKLHRNGYYGSNDHDLIIMKECPAADTTLHRRVGIAGSSTLPLHLSTLEDLQEHSMGTITICDTKTPTVTSNPALGVAAKSDIVVENHANSVEALPVSDLSDDGGNYIRRRQHQQAAGWREHQSSSAVPVSTLVLPANVPEITFTSSFENSTISRTQSGDDSIDSTVGMKQNGSLFGTTIGYAFDLGQSFKNEIMRKHDSAASAYYYGTSSQQHHHRQQNVRSSPSRISSAHSNVNSSKFALPGPTLMEVVPPYSVTEEAASDSEADSWAQTDGNSIRSLEERLDDVTGEI